MPNFVVDLVLVSDDLCKLAKLQGADLCEVRVAFKRVSYSGLELR